MYDLVKSYSVPLNSLIEIKKFFPNELSCMKYMEQFRWSNIPQSPFKKGSKIYICGNSKYRCKDTHKYFTVKTHTVFDGTKVPLQSWFIAIIVYLNFEKDFKASYDYMSNNLELSPRTIWLLLDKIRYASNHANYKKIISKLNVFPYFEFILTGFMKVPRKQ